MLNIRHLGGSGRISESSDGIPTLGFMLSGEFASLCPFAPPPTCALAVSQKSLKKKKIINIRNDQGNITKDPADFQGIIK